MPAAEAVAKFGRRLARNDCVSRRRRMEGPGRRAPREVENAEGALVEILLRPLVDREKDVVHRAEQSGSAPVRPELRWLERQESGLTVSAAMFLRARHMHRFGVSWQLRFAKSPTVKQAWPAGGLLCGSVVAQTPRLAKSDV